MHVCLECFLISPCCLRATRCRFSPDCSEDLCLSLKRERAAALGIPLDATARQALKSGPVRHSDLKVELEAALAYSVEHHTEREAVVDRRELEATALKQAMGKAVLAEIRAHAGVAMPNLIPLEGDFVVAGR